MQRAYNWLIYKVIHKALHKAFAQYAKGKLLDIGCGKKPYRDILSQYVEVHIGLDHEHSPHSLNNVELIGSCYEIPSESDSFDTIICTDVLEHLEEPAAAISESYRVLKSGGISIYTTPLFWHLHEQPRDFYRYTEYGLKYLFEKASFTVVDIKPIGGFWVTVGQESCYYLWDLRRKTLGKYNPINLMIVLAVHSIQGISYVLNKLDRSRKFTTEYLIVAKK